MTSRHPASSSVSPEVKGMREEFEATLIEFATKQLPNDDNGRTNFLTFEKSLYSEPFSTCNLLDTQPPHEEYSFRNLKSPESDSDLPSSNVVFPADENIVPWLQHFSSRCETRQEELRAEAEAKEAKLRHAIDLSLSTTQILESYVEQVKAQSIESVNALEEPLILKRERQNRRWEHMYCRIRELMSS